MQRMANTYHLIIYNAIIMKQTSFLFLNILVLFFLTGFTSCEKDDTTVQRAIVGKWVNVTGNEDHIPVESDDSIEFLSDGTILYHDDILTLTARPSRYEIKGNFLYMYYVDTTSKEDSADIFVCYFSDDFNRLELNNVISSSTYPNVYKRLK